MYSVQNIFSIFNLNISEFFQINIDEVNKYLKQTKKPHYSSRKSFINRFQLGISLNKSEEKVY